MIQCTQYVPTKTEGFSKMTSIIVSTFWEHCIILGSMIYYLVAEEMGIKMGFRITHKDVC